MKGNTGHKRRGSAEGQEKKPLSGERLMSVKLLFKMMMDEKYIQLKKSKVKIHLYLDSECNEHIRLI